MSAEETKSEREKGEKEEKKEPPPLETNLKTTTETSTYFFLSKFNSKDVPCAEKLPRSFKHLDNLLNVILLNLEETENVFVNQAKEVMERDLTLINWRLRLVSLQKNLKEKKRDFERIDQTVQCILRLSSHIDDILRKLEKELPEPSLIENAFKYSPARMTMSVFIDYDYGEGKCLWGKRRYDAMMKISINQRDMLQRLSTAVLALNETIQLNPLDPVEQFTRILSLHTEVLGAIELRTGQLEEHLKRVASLRQFHATSKKPTLCDYYYYWFNG